MADYRCRIVPYVTTSKYLSVTNEYFGTYKPALRSIDQGPGTVWRRRDRGPGAFHLIHEGTNHALIWMGGTGLGLLHPDRYQYDQDKDHLIFTGDLLDPAPWFALNNNEHDKVVDVDHGRTDENTPVIGFPWNGGDNQKWRMEDA